MNLIPHITSINYELNTDIHMEIDRLHVQISQASDIPIKWKAGGGKLVTKAQTRRVYPRLDLININEFWLNIDCFLQSIDYSYQNSLNTCR